MENIFCKNYGQVKWFEKSLCIVSDNIDAFMCKHMLKTISMKSGGKKRMGTVLL